MQEAILYINEVGKRKDKTRIKGMFPLISRADIMAGILSEHFNPYERAKLAKLYKDIILMEQDDLKYISEVAVSSKEDMEIYEMLKKANRMSRQRIH